MCGVCVYVWCVCVYTCMCDVCVRVCECGVCVVYECVCVCMTLCV